MAALDHRVGRMMRAQRVVAIDPGFSSSGRGNAVALFARGKLTGTLFMRSSEFAERLPLAVPGGIVVVEKPQFDGRPSGALIDLTAEGLLLAGMFAGAWSARVLQLTPRAWKGSEAKPLHHRRLWAVLSPAERTLLGGEDTAAQIAKALAKGKACRWGAKGGSYYPANWIQHNVLDAVALGCFTLERLPKI